MFLVLITTQQGRLIVSLKDDFPGPVSQVLYFSDSVDVDDKRFMRSHKLFGKKSLKAFRFLASSYTPFWCGLVFLVLFFEKKISEGIRNIILASIERQFFWDGFDFVALVPLPIRLTHRKPCPFSRVLEHNQRDALQMIRAHILNNL